MHTVFKYTLQVTDKQVLKLPKGAEILTIQTQYGMPQLWALVDTSVSQKDEQVIWVFGTGHPIPNQLTKEEYLGTFQLDDGMLVFHVFRDRPASSSL